MLIALLSIILFIFFNAKRRQRIIPIIEPLVNSTVDFTKTIGNLYFQQNNNADLINKKIIKPLEKIKIDKKNKILSKAEATKVDFFTLVRGESE